LSTIILVGVLSGTGGALTGLALARVPIRRLRDALAAARHDATHDPLTALPNRRALHEHLLAALRGRRPVGLILLDLDDFKNVNDTRGHPAGDHLLKVVAARLAALPAPVTMVARLGGDEFVLVTQAHVSGSRTSSAEQTGLTAHAARQSVGQLVPIGSDAVTVSASAGFAVTGESRVASLDAIDAARQLLHDADLALYEAKTTGSGVHAHVPAPSRPPPPTSRPTPRRRDQRRQP
jgi:diguanylate cyclase (GGDEF)-like protein